MGNFLYTLGQNLLYLQLHLTLHPRVVSQIFFWKKISCAVKNEVKNPNATSLKILPQCVVHETMHSGSKGRREGLLFLSYISVMVSYHSFFFCIFFWPAPFLRASKKIGKITVWPQMFLGKNHFWILVLWAVIFFSLIFEK